MQKKILDAVFRLSIHRGKIVIIGVTLITIVLGAFIPRLIISSSQQNLIPKDHPEQAKFLQFQKEFGAAGNLIVVLEGDSEMLKLYAEDFAREIKKEEKWVRSVFYKVDVGVLLSHAPLYMSVDELNRGLDLLKKNKAWISRIENMSSLYAVLQEISKELKKPHEDISVETATKIVSFLDALFREWHDWIANPHQINLKLAEKLSMDGFPQLAILQSGGYLFSRDFKMLFILVQPRSANDEITYLRPFIADMRKACDRALNARPNFKDKVRVAFTGVPAHVLTEVEIIYSDVGSAGVLSVVIVSIVLLIGFRSFKKMLIAAIPTIAGIVISLGIITITIGRLNLISSSFLAVLFGIGIDFGIYLLQRTEEELGNGLPLQDAIYTSVVLTSRSIISGGLTTSFAFLALAASKFVGYSELGWAAGIGLLVVMCTTFLMMPPLLLMIPVAPRDYHVKETIISTERLERKKIHLVIIGVGVVVTAFSVYAATRNRMDYNVLKLLPRNTESTVYQLKMEENSDLKMSSAWITDTDLERLKGIIAQVKKLPTVSRVDSLAEMIPSDQEKKIPIVKKFRPLLGNFRIRFGQNNYTADDYLALMDMIDAYFEEAQEKAFSGGQTKMVKQIEGLMKSMGSVRAALSGGGRAAALERTKRFEAELFENINQATKIIRESMNPTLVTESTFPKELIARFKSPNGTYAAMVFPSGSMWDITFLDSFVLGLKKITPNVTGFPVTHRVYVRLAAFAVFQAMIYSFVVILLLLVLDFWRRPKGIALSLMPLVLGMLWMQLVIYAAGIEYNVANIAGLPLLLGLGIVYGLRMVHRWMEDPTITAFAATKTTGRGLAFAALAIIIGLFSIIPARHKAVSDFGIMLLIGVVLCLFTALVILPAMIDYLYLMKRKVSAEEEPAAEARREYPPSEIRAPARRRRPQSAKRGSRQEKRSKRAQQVTQAKRTKGGKQPKVKR